MEHQLNSGNYCNKEITKLQKYGKDDENTKELIKLLSEGFSVFKIEDSGSICQLYYAGWVTLCGDEFGNLPSKEDLRSDPKTICLYG